MTTGTYIRLAAICTAAAVYTTAVHADLVGVLDVTTGSGFSQTISIDGTETGQGMVAWSEQILTEDFLVAITMVGDPTAPSLGTVVQATNSSNAPMHMAIDFTMPITAMDGGSIYWMGSLAASLNGTDVLLESVFDTAVWTASLGDDTLGSLFHAPFELAVDGTGSNNAMDSGEGAVTWSGGDTLAVHFEYSLDSGATVMFNGGVGVIPAPGGLALLGIAAARRRRRQR
ncbi:MAG: hypothetical protein QF781_08435 [Phycisphaerales bacterium]|jgi:hypothetical protein|nr:hypothetical protein [Phycisphaerales bacterium]MDP7086621.1 hypothetical protein [Phycisphaerales bacterium]|tara:strand:+ start:366 stop:1052 length:687 start_codon:yes stop_codon:yes gene_type:complete